MLLFCFSFIFGENVAGLQCLVRLHRVANSALTFSQICESNKTCEIDPIKLKEGDNVEVNKVNIRDHWWVFCKELKRQCQGSTSTKIKTFYSHFLLLQENLQVYVQKVFSSITQSSANCPPLMCDVFRSLRHLACKRFLGNEISLRALVNVIQQMFNVFFLFFPFKTKHKLASFEIVLQLF